MGIGPHGLGLVNQKFVDWCNANKFDSIMLLGSGAAMADLLDRLNYKPTYAILRLWFSHQLNYSGGVLTIDPDHWNDMLLWARETSEYRVHKIEDTVVRQDFPAQWNEIWEPGTNAERRCVQKFMDWTRADWDAVRGRDNVYAMGFIPGLAGNQIIPEYFVFEAERIAAMWDGGLPDARHLKTAALNLATGQFAPDKGFWYSPQFGFFASVSKQYLQTLHCFHAYCHGSQRFEFGENTVTSESPDLFPRPTAEIGADFRIYPPEELRAWAAFLPHKVYKEVYVPAGLGEAQFGITEAGYDRIFKDAWPRMTQEYYRGLEPSGFWEYAGIWTGWQTSHWRYMGLLDPYIERAKGNWVEAAQWFAAFDIAWMGLQDEQHPETKARLLFCARTDDDPSWSEHNFYNTFIFPERVAQARKEILEGQQPPPPPDSGSGCEPLSWIIKKLTGN